jgi:hypothetical protein
MNEHFDNSKINALFLTETDMDWKSFKSPEYNYRFNRKTGFFVRWGRSFGKNPERSPFGPEIADIEISTICGGVTGKLCPYCYKSNAKHGRNMSLSTFKTIIEKINVNNQLTQAAFGLGATGEENPAIWDMCTWLRERNIVPNGTIANASEKTMDRIADNFGACAVSNHFLSSDKGNGLCYDNVKRLTDRGMKQVNIHYVLSRETYENAFTVLRDIKEDPRLKSMHAIVFLSLKPKGRAMNNKFELLPVDQFNKLIRTALSMNINIGFDSCSFPKFSKAVEDLSDREKLLMIAEGCESFGRFSVNWRSVKPQAPVVRVAGMISGNSMTKAGI